MADANPIDNDPDIAHLEASIRRRVGGRLLALCILRRNNGLILRGRAPNYHLEQLAQHAVMQATSTPIEANEIEVI